MKIANYPTGTSFGRKLQITNKGQSMTEYLLVVFLIFVAVFEAVRTFGIALNAAFAQAIINIAVNIR